MPLQILASSTLPIQAPSLHLYGMLLQALVPLHYAPHQKRPAPPKCAQASLILCPAALTVAKSRTQREANAAQEIPRAYPPPQRPQCGLVPSRLRLQHEQRARDDEARATDNLRRPVQDDGHGPRHPVVDARQRGEARDPEDGGGKELGEGREEPELVDVVRAQLVPCGEPDPGPGIWGKG